MQTRLCGPLAASRRCRPLADRSASSLTMSAFFTAEALRLGRLAELATITTGFHRRVNALSVSGFSGQTAWLRGLTIQERADETRALIGDALIDLAGVADAIRSCFALV